MMEHPFEAVDVPSLRSSTAIHANPDDPEPPAESYLQDRQGGMFYRQLASTEDFSFPSLGPNTFLLAPSLLESYTTTSNVNPSFQPTASTYEGDNGMQGGMPFISREEYIISATCHLLSALHPGSTPTKQQVEGLIRYAREIHRSRSDS